MFQDRVDQEDRVMLKKMINIGGGQIRIGTCRLRTNTNLVIEALEEGNIEEALKFK